MGNSLDGFISLFFFSFGFLTLVFILGIFLNFFLKLRLYTFYSLYSLSILIFIILAFTKELNFYNENKLLLLTLIDVIQVFSNLFYCIFLYETLVNFDKKYKKLKILNKVFIAFVSIHTCIAIVFNDFFIASFTYFMISRIIIYLISLTFFYVLYKNTKHTYFKFLFVSATVLYCSGFVALIESMINIRDNNAFLYLCIGYFIENICFLGFIIYNYFNEKQLKMKNEVEFQKELLAQNIEIQLQTMQQIGREIHDNIGQKLTLASLYSQQLILAKNKDNLQEKVLHITEIINESLSELRELSKSLTDDSIQEQTIALLIEKECSKINALKKCIVKFEYLTSEYTIEYDIKIVILRIIQEFLQNSIKHSQCEKIFIKLRNQDAFIDLSMEDDGIGFNYNTIKNKGIGIKNIKKRTELVKGTFQLNSGINLGTKITIQIPIP